MKNNLRNMGNYYENLAVEYLKNNNYQIIQQNYQFKTIDFYRPLELDIIAFKDNILYFFEVKYRSNKNNINNFFPSSQKKIQNIEECGENFLYHYGQWRNYHINISWIIVHNNQFSILNLY